MSISCSLVPLGPLYFLFLLLWGVPVVQLWCCQKFLICCVSLMMCLIVMSDWVRFPCLFRQGAAIGWGLNSLAGAEVIFGIGLNMVVGVSAVWPIVPPLCWLHHPIGAAIWGWATFLLWWLCLLGIWLQVPPSFSAGRVVSLGRMSCYLVFCAGLSSFYLISSSDDVRCGA